MSLDNPPANRLRPGWIQVSVRRDQFRAHAAGPERVQHSADAICPPLHYVPRELHACATPAYDGWRNDVLKGQEMRKFLLLFLAAPLAHAQVPIDSWSNIIDSTVVRTFTAAPLNGATPLSALSMPLAQNGLTTT